VSHRIDLEFVRPAWPRARAVGWLLLVAGCAGLAWRADVHAARGEALQRAQARHDALLLRAQPSRTTADDDDEAGRLQVQRANAVIGRLALPWDALFDAIEGADARTLALLAIEPNARDGTVRISGEARSFSDLLAYIDRLAAQAGLSQVHLQNYEWQARGAARVVSFQVMARWSLP
jgi:Tfp pilus assembly protein PilN